MYFLQIISPHIHYTAHKTAGMAVNLPKISSSWHQWHHCTTHYDTTQHIHFFWTISPNFTDISDKDIKRLKTISCCRNQPQQYI